MAKNMTRRSLAIGSAFALASSAFVAVPAMAAPGINLSDLNEVGLYSMIEGETFALLGSGNADFNTNNQSRLRVMITNVNGSDNAPTITVKGATADAVSYSTSGATDTALGTTAGDDGVFTRTSMTSPFQVTIKAGAMSAADVEKYDVQVWDDADNDGTIDSGEYASPVRTVTFIESADVAVNHTIGALTEGDGQVTGSFSVSGVDTAQLTIASFSVHLTSGLDAELAYTTNAATGGTAIGLIPLVVAGASGSAAASKLYYDATNNVFAWKTAAAASATVDVASDPYGTTLKVAVAKNTAVKAQALYKTGGSEAVGDTLGKDSYAGISALSLATLTADTVASTTATVGDLFNNADGTTFAVKATAIDADSDPVAGLAVTATVTVPTGALGAADNQLVINGVTYTDEAKLPGATGVAEIALVTDAKGVVTLSLTATDFAASDTVNVAFTAENKTANQTVTAKAATYKAYIVNHDEKAVVTSGGSAFLDIEVYDQFGGYLPTGYDARALFQSTANFTATGETVSDATADVTASISGGKARLGVTPNGVGTGTTTYDIDIQKRAAGNSYAAYVSQVADFVIESVSALTVADTISITTGTAAYGDDADTTTIEITDFDGAGSGATTGQPVEAADFISWANRAVVGATEPSLNAGFSLAGNLNKKATSTSALVNAQDQFVTFTASNDHVMFVASVDQDSTNVDEKIYAARSITVPTDASGNFDVNVHSNVSGTYTVTITSGATSQVVEISVEAPATTAGTSLVIDAPSYAAPGSTVIAKATVTDEYGNAVVLAANSGTTEGDISVTYKGPGLAVVASADATDADGVAQIAHFLGSNDSGTITITAKYDQNGDEDYTDADDLVVTKTIIIGTAPVVAPVVADTKVNAGSFLGYVAVYALGHKGSEISWKIAGKWFKTTVTSDYQVFQRKTVDVGVDVNVDIYITAPGASAVKLLTKVVATR